MMPLEESMTRTHFVAAAFALAWVSSLAWAAEPALPEIVWTEADVATIPDTTTPLPYPFIVEIKSPPTTPTATWTIRCASKVKLNGWSWADPKKKVVTIRVEPVNGGTVPTPITATVDGDGNIAITDFPDLTRNVDYRVTMEGAFKKTVDDRAVNVNIISKAVTLNATNWYRK
jgi:hypothetical protein